MKKILLVGVLGSLVVACSSSSSSGGGGGGGGNNPAPPALGAQIDRQGRPAINTATNHSFDANEDTKGAAKNDWNGNSDPSTWVAKYAGEIQKNLAILDAIDGTCGNQLFADKMKTDGSRYGTFASVLADDRL